MSKDNDDLRIIFRYLDEKLTSIQVRLYAMQRLLQAQEKPPFSGADVDDMMEVVRQELESFRKKRLAEANDESYEKALRRLLESHEGTKQ